MKISKVSSKWQVVVPKDVRHELGIEPGSELAFEVEEGRAVMYPVPSDPVQRLFGSFSGHDLLGDLKSSRRKDRDHEEDRS